MYNAYVGLSQTNLQKTAESAISYHNMDMVSVSRLVFSFFVHKTSPKNIKYNENPYRKL